MERKRLEPKYYGEFVSVQDEIEGDGIVRYFRTRKRYGLEGYEKLIKGKKMLLEKMLYYSKGKENENVVKLTADIHSMEKMMEELKDKLESGGQDGGS